MMSKTKNDTLKVSYVFELQQVKVWGRYPSRNADYFIVGLFDTYNHAKRAMHDFIKQEKERCVHIYGNEKEYYKDCLGYFIREKAVYSHLPQEYEPVLKHSSYTSNGELNDNCDINETGQYIGRQPQNIRFKVGEIVEVLQHRRSELAIVGGLPPTEEWVKERTEYCKKEHPNIFFCLDESDDSYMVYSIGEGNTHSHPLCTSVFYPSRKIPAGIVEKLRKKLQEMTDIQKQS